MEWQTTFWLDFSIADKFGASAVRDTFKRAFREWKDDIVYLTELSIVTNLKCWQHYEVGNEEISRMYSEFYYKTREYAHDNFTGEDIDYYFRMTD